MDLFNELEQLKKLLDDGVITQEEFEREKARVLSTNYSVQPAAGWNLGIDEKSFVALMHASQFLSAFIAPIIIWLVFKDKSKLVDEVGKNIINFQISIVLYGILLCITCVGIVLLPLLGIAVAVLIIIAIIKTLNGEKWSYPLTLKLLK